MSQRLRSGQVAKAAGVNVETLRYYERRGILAEPARGESGYREYPHEAVRVVRFVKHAQELGFTLAEVEELLVLRADSERTCDEVRATAATKICEIDAKIESLNAMKQALETLVDTCVDGVSSRECPILEALDEKAQR